MIGTLDVSVQAKFPSMPLDPMQAFANSPSSIRLRNVPKRIGDWCIRNVQFVVTYPDGTIKTADCVLTGGVWVGTIEGTQTVGTSKSGYSIFASGTDENGNQVTGYCLGKGDVEILESDGTLTPGKSLAYVHLLSADSTGENDGDLWRDLGGTWRIQQDGEAWLIGDDSGAIAQVSAELSSKADLSAIPRKTSDLTNDSDFVTSAQIRPFWNPLAIGVPTGVAQFAQGIAFTDENSRTDNYGELLAKKSYNRDATLNLRAELHYSTFWNFVLTMFKGISFSEQPVQLYFCNGQIRKMRSGRPQQYYTGYMWRSSGVTESGYGYAIPCSDDGIPDGRMIEFDAVDFISVPVVSFNATQESSRVHAITGNPSWTVLETIDGESGEITCTRYTSPRGDSHTLQLADVNYVSSYVDSQVSGKADTSYVDAQLSGKVDASDLPYALSERKEWQYSGLPEGVQVVSLVWENYTWTLTLSDGSIYQTSSASEEETEIYFYGTDLVIVATKTGIFLLDRAVNAVEVTGATTIALPALVNSGKARDFLLRATIPSGTTVAGLITFAASGNEQIAFETDGDEFPVPDETGTWIYSFTETTAHTFAVGLKQLNQVAQGGN